MNFDDLTPEQLAKAGECADAKELVQLAIDEGIELTDEQVSAITGGTAFTAGTYNFNRKLWANITE